ncbi:hypothetical protein L2E82_16421 [Cichorium intybus]|uniref:Uncharacterized protein n=1 Tax=Cichorium intybus TaxID=13427 RepID=A0ACB9F637_CICIN|nr:hypothetical protein L2E82_16421 [Cichorium intybus]
MTAAMQSLILISSPSDDLMASLPDGSLKGSSMMRKKFQKLSRNEVPGDVLDSYAQAVFDFDFVSPVQSWVFAKSQVPGDVLDSYTQAGFEMKDVFLLLTR